MKQVISTLLNILVDKTHIMMAITQIIQLR